MKSMKFKTSIEQELFNDHVVACSVRKRSPRDVVRRVEDEVDSELGIVANKVGAVAAHDAAVGLAIGMNRAGPRPLPFGGKRKALFKENALDLPGATP